MLKFTKAEKRKVLNSKESMPELYRIAIAQNKYAFDKESKRGTNNVEEN